MNNKEVVLASVAAPKTFEAVESVILTDETMAERKKKLLKLMKSQKIDLLIIYADREHGSNFEYLTGFIPRFEEGLLLLDQSGEATLILGNENLKMAAHSRISVKLLHSPLFSLPNQPMEHERPLEQVLKEAGVSNQQKIGVAGWKLFTAQQQNEELFDLPYFIVSALQKAAGEATLVNAASLLIGPEKGARIVNNANEIAHYEYGANLASICMLKAMDAIEEGISEIELGALLEAEGQPQSVVTIAAAGQRFEKANLYPSSKKVKKGDPISLTTGFKGGLSSRTGFAIADEADLPDTQKDYLERVAMPYFKAVAVWLQTMKCGISGDEIYQKIEKILPKEHYGWHLNPGHLVADEEWMSSPIYSGSSNKIQSGMIFQLDIIPSVKGYTGVSAEECVAIADEKLRDAIRQDYPELWQRIEQRRDYLKKELMIQLSEDILPLSNTVAYLRPFYLAKDKAFIIKEKD